jgi:hypothetical protein
MQVSRQIVEQRIRNRLFEWLDAVVSSEREDDLGELINQWSDWTNEAPVADYFSPPVFTANELSALGLVQSEIEKFCELTPDILSAEHWPQWANVKASAQAAWSCFSIRGFLPEEDLLQR